MSLRSHAEWATTLDEHADNQTHPDHVEHWRYYADQHRNADTREAGTGCASDR